MADKITYTNKTDLTDLTSINEVNKVTAADLNEVKKATNGLINRFMVYGKVSALNTTQTLVSGNMWLIEPQIPYNEIVSLIQQNFTLSATPSVIQYMYILQNLIYKVGTISLDSVQTIYRWSSVVNSKDSNPNLSIKFFLWNGDDQKYLINNQSTAKIWLCLMIPDKIIVNNNFTLYFNYKGD